MRRSVSSPDESLRRELKIWHAAEYFWRTSACFIWWWNTVSHAWYYFSNKMILEWEIKGAKMSGFSSDFQTLIVFSIWIINEFRRCKENRNSVSNWVAYCFHMTTDLTTKHKVKFILPIGFLPWFSWSSKEVVRTSTTSSHFRGQGATRVHLKGKRWKLKFFMEEKEHHMNCKTDMMQSVS